MLPTPEQLNAARELIKASGETVKTQAETAQKFPWGWAIVVMVIMFAVSWGINSWYFSGQLEKKDKRITALETTITNNAAEYQRTNDRIRFYYDDKNQKLLDEIKTLYYKIGGMDGVKK